MKTDILALYRCHDLNDLRKKCLKILLHQFGEVAGSNISSKFIIIADDVNDKEFLEGISQKGVEILYVNSKTEDKRLTKGSCTSQHYTLYITSVDLAKKYSEDDTVIFFIEDDYVFRPDAFAKCFHFARKYKNDFIAPFDHPDRYKNQHRKSEHFYREEKLTSGKDIDILHGGMGDNLENVRKGYLNYKLDIAWEYNHHWRTVVSTCHTFVCSFYALKMSEPYLFNADIQRGDHIMWTHIWSGGKQKLWSPISGLARHMGHNPYNELLFDWEWEKYFDEH